MIFVKIAFNSSVYVLCVCVVESSFRFISINGEFVIWIRPTMICIYSLRFSPGGTKLHTIPNSIWTLFIIRYVSCSICISSHCRSIKWFHVSSHTIAYVAAKKNPFHKQFWTFKSLLIYVVILHIVSAFVFVCYVPLHFDSQSLNGMYYNPLDRLAVVLLYLNHIFKRLPFSILHFNNELFSVFDDIIILFRYCNGFGLFLNPRNVNFQRKNVECVQCISITWNTNTFVSFCSGRNWCEIPQITLSKKSSFGQMMANFPIKYNYECKSRSLKNKFQIYRLSLYPESGSVEHSIISSIIDQRNTEGSQKKKVIWKIPSPSPMPIQIISNK